jgi:hypothetical protein
LASRVVGCGCSLALPTDSERRYDISRVIYRDIPYQNVYYPISTPMLWPNEGKQTENQKPKVKAKQFKGSLETPSI